MKSILSLSVVEPLPMEIITELKESLKKIPGVIEEKGVFKVSGRFMKISALGISIVINNADDIPFVRSILQSLFEENPGARMFFEKKMKQRRFIPVH